MTAPIRLMKFIDSIAGPLAVLVMSLFDRKHRDVNTNLSTALVIRPGGIGDAVLLMPMLSLLKKINPRCQVTVLAEHRNNEVFSMCSSVDRVLSYDRPHEFGAALRGRYDAVIDTEQWHRLSAVVARLTGAAMLIGFATNERMRLFTHGVPYLQDEPEINSFARLVGPIRGDAQVEASPPFLMVPEPAQERADVLLRSLQGRPFAAIFPGGSIKERQWGAARFHAVARRLVESGYGIVVVGGREDAEAGKEIASGLASALAICGKATLTETAGVLKRSALLITGDSGIMHVAYGLGTLTVSLFGPGREKKWAPRGENHIVINRHLSCSPCTKFGYTPTCRKNAECMKRITPDEVFERAVEVLEGKTHASD